MSGVIARAGLAAGITEEQARKVIEAIRAHTPEMREAGADPSTGNWGGAIWSGAVGGSEEEMAGYVFEAMIDTILSKD